MNKINLLIVLSLLAFVAIGCNRLAPLESTATTLDLNIPKTEDFGCSPENSFLPYVEKKASVLVRLCVVDGKKRIFSIKPKYSDLYSGRDRFVVKDYATAAHLNALRAEQIVSIRNSMGDDTAWVDRPGKDAVADPEEPGTRIYYREDGHEEYALIRNFLSPESPEVVEIAKNLKLP